MATRGWLLNGSSRLKLAILISVVLPCGSLVRYQFQVSLPTDSKAGTPLEVVLANSKSASKPGKADALAKANLDGGGNSRSDRQAKTPFPLAQKNNQAAETEAAWQESEQLEQEAQRPVTEADSDETMYPADLLCGAIRKEVRIRLTPWVWFSAALRSHGSKRGFPVNYEPYQHRLNANSSAPAPRTTALPVMLKTGASSGTDRQPQLSRSCQARGALWKTAAHRWDQVGWESGISRNKPLIGEKDSG